MKRDTDPEKWKKQFFKRLNHVEMLFWLYINDDCDHSGVWYVDTEVASMRVKAEIDIAKMIEVFNLDEERVLLFHGGKKILIKSFVVFQYSENPSPKNRLHLAAEKTLRGHGFEWFNGVVTELERPKVQVQVKDKAFGKSENLLDQDFNQLEAFNEIWELYPSRGRLRRSASLRIWCEIVVSRAYVTRIQTALSRYSAHLKANGWKQPMEAAKFLAEWPDWENYAEPEKEETDAERDARILAKYQK